MGEYSHNLPFGILDVAELLGLNVRREQAHGVYADCPFCGDARGKFFLSTVLDSFHCNYCDERGGILAMYSRLCNKSKYDARCEIEERLRIPTQASDYDYKVNERKKAPKIINSALAPATDVHDTLTEMLKMLALSGYHRRSLHVRGLTDTQIGKLGYKSMPPLRDCKLITDKLLALGLTVQGVPGFYERKDGTWTMSGGSWANGFLIPYRTIDGLTGGFQIRLDVPLKNKNDPPDKAGAKYIWLSSASKHMGVSPNSPVHFVGDPNAETVYVTEGALKSDISYSLSGRTFVAIAGANNTGKLDGLFQILAANGTKRIIEAEDMDKMSNENVARGAAKIIAIARKNGLESRSLTWSAYKGIDDWLLSRSKNHIMETVSSA